MSGPVTAIDPKRTALLVMDYRLFILSDGTEDPDAETRDFLLGKVSSRRAQIIDIAGFRSLLPGP